jgi:predicted RNA-binding protein with PUA-like domain
MNYWLIKSEPNEYSWDNLVKDKKTVWHGIRNYTARNNLKSMAVGDQLFFYHSNIGKEIVGIAEVIKTPYQDPTTEDVRWFSVDIAPVKALNKPVSLEYIKTDPKLSEMKLLKLSRLSVSPVTEGEFERIIRVSEER